MGLRNLPDIAENLIRNGKSEDTPVAVVSNGACAKNQTVRGTLSTICENVKSAEVVPPAVIVVGETAKFDFAPTITDRSKMFRLPLQVRESSPTSSAKCLRFRVRRSKDMTF